MNQQFIPYPMHVPRVTAMSSPGQSPVSIQHNLIVPCDTTTLRPSHMHMNIQQNLVTPGNMTMSRPGHMLRHGIENILAPACIPSMAPVCTPNVAPVYTPNIPNAKPAFRFGYRLATAQYNLAVSSAQSLSNERQCTETSVTRDSYRKRDLYYLTPSENAVNQMLDNFTTFLHAELKVFAQILPSGKQSELDNIIITATNSISSLKYSPNDSTGNLTTTDLQFLKTARRKNPVARKRTKTGDDSLFGGKIIKEVDRVEDAETKAKSPANPFRIFSKNSPECSLAVKRIKQELQDNPSKVLSNIPTTLLKEDSNVTLPDAILSNVTGAQLNSPPVTDDIEIVTLDDIEIDVTSTSET